MTVEKFNALPTDEQFTFFRESLGDRCCGLFNLMLFGHMAIVAQFEQSGRPDFALARAVPVEGREIAKLRLKRMPGNCSIYFWNTIDEADKAAILKDFIHHYQSQN